MFGEMEMDNGILVSLCKLLFSYVTKTCEAPSNHILDGYRSF